MSSKRNSTIGAKPNVQPNIEAWIGAGATESSTTSNSEVVSQPDSQQARQPAGQAAQYEPMAMLSARIPATLMRKLRIRAATEERQIQDIIADLLRDYLGED